MQAPAIAVANCGQLIISTTFGAIPLKTDLAKSVPAPQIKINFTADAETAPHQYLFLK